jgi:hypothetical protein
MHWPGGSPKSLEPLRHITYVGFEITSEEECHQTKELVRSINGWPVLSHGGFRAYCVLTIPSPLSEVTVDCCRRSCKGFNRKYIPQRLCPTSTAILLCAIRVCLCVSMHTSLRHKYSCIGLKVCTVLYGTVLYGTVLYEGYAPMYLHTQ